MARSSDINQRIVLSGAEEVRRHLEEIGKAGERSGNATRAALLAATQGTNSFTTGARQASTSSGQMRFALQNLSFQVNDVATSLASGGDVMRVFAQQGGQIFQVFQQGGGFSAVMGAATTAIRNFITPTKAAVAALAALGAGIALLASRAASGEQSAKQFDVILKATGRSGRTTGKDLEEAAKKLHDVGVSTNEAREAFRKFIGEGGVADQAPKIVRIGADLNKVLGEGSMERFISAAAKGGAPLEEFAKQLGIVVPNAAETQKALDAAAKSAANFNKSLNDAIVSQNRSIADERRNALRSIGDLTRARGTPEEEIQRASSERIKDIVRQTNQTINDLIAQRNAENAAALAAYNQQITDAAQAAANKQSLIVQIGQKVLGSFQGSITPLQQAVVDFSVQWNNLLDTLAKSETITTLVRDLGSLVTSIGDAIKFADKLGEAIRNIPGLPTIPAAFRSDVPITQRLFSAEGGLVRGPGTGTSDSIPAQLSNGEFVLRAAAVRRLGVDFLSALNMGSIMPRTRGPRFAAGGLVSAGGGGGSVILQFPSGATVGPMMADRQIFQAVQREARRAGMKSAGKLPSTG